MDELLDLFRGVPSEMEGERLPCDGDEGTHVAGKHQVGHVFIGAMVGEIVSVCCNVSAGVTYVDAVAAIVVGGLVK